MLATGRDLKASRTLPPPFLEPLLLLLASQLRAWVRSCVPALSPGADSGTREEEKALVLLFGGFAQTMGQDQSKDGADVPGLCDCTTKQRRPPDDTDRLHALNTPRPAWQGHGARLSPEMVCRRDGGSLLHLSAARGDTFSVVAFVRGGHFAVNTRDNLGRTPLMLAAYFGCSSTVKLLYEIGANMDAEDCQGRTALMHSVEQEQWEVADWIKWQVWLSIDLCSVVCDFI